MPILPPTIPPPSLRSEPSDLVSAERLANYRHRGFLDRHVRTALESGEIIQEVIVPVEDCSTGVSYQKMAATRLRLCHGRCCRPPSEVGRHVGMARIGVTGLGPKAFRAKNAESLLEGTAASPSDIQKAAAAVAEGVEASSDLHASADYRMHMAQVYAARALAIAFSRTA